ncbi:MAG: alginate export family protein [Candidatus Riflebacteria bacterium]|jgi:hypothetical protein|nr:alginate export family protein [Candidatus Riflebacteria bacterium]
MKKFGFTLLTFFAFFATTSLLSGNEPGVAQSTAKDAVKKTGSLSDEWEFKGNYRFRVEILDGFNTKFYGDRPARGDSRDTLFIHRLRTIWKRNLGHDGWKMSIGMQDARAGGLSLSDKDFKTPAFDGIENNPYKDYLELHDTFIEWSRKDHPLSFKGGRQKIYFGDQRCFGPGEFGNSGRWIWDALSFTWKAKKDFVSAFYGNTLLHVPDEFSLNHRHGYEGGGLYGHFEARHLTFDPFFAFKQDDHLPYKGEAGASGRLSNKYWGLYLATRPGKDFQAAGTFVKSGGSKGGTSVDAHGWHLRLENTFKNKKYSPGLSFEYSFASGDSNPADRKDESFDGMFGARDKLYGRMNLMHWQNLDDRQVNLGWVPAVNWKASVEGHQFHLAESKDAWYLNASKYRDKTGVCGTDLGRELDVIVQYSAPAKKQSWEMVYSYFSPGSFVDNILAKEKKTAHKSHYFYLMWSLTF